MLMTKNRICVPNHNELKRKILEKIHTSVCTLHPSSTKMYLSLKEHYWWQGMKKEITKYD